MSKRQGYQFQKEISQSLEKLKSEKYGRFLWWERIVDTKAWGIKCYKCGAPLFPKMMMPRQPADHLFIINSKICYIEEKSSENDVSYNITWIKPHQLKSAYEITDAGGKYYFLLCRRVPFNMECFVLTPDELTDAILEMEYKTAIKWHNISKRASMKLERDTKTKTWNMEPIVTKVKNGI